MTRLLGPDLKCIECRKKRSYDEPEVETKGKKKYWVCPQCYFENLFFDIIRNLNEGRLTAHVGLVNTSFAGS